MYKSQTEQIYQGVGKRYKAVYEGFIFEGDSDGLNVRYAERYTDLSWMLNAYDGVEIIDTYYNENCPEPDDYDPCADCSDHACEYGSCSMSRG